MNMSVCVWTYSTIAIVLQIYTLHHSRMTALCRQALIHSQIVCGALLRLACLK